MPGQATRSHVPQLRVCMLQLKRIPQRRPKITCATTKTQGGQINVRDFRPVALHDPPGKGFQAEIVFCTIR